MVFGQVGVHLYPPAACVELAALQNVESGTEVCAAFEHVAADGRGQVAEHLSDIRVIFTQNSAKRFHCAKLINFGGIGHSARSEHIPHVGKCHGQVVVFSVRSMPVQNTDSLPRVVLCAVQLVLPQVHASQIHVTYAGFGVGVAQSIPTQGQRFSVVLQARIRVAVFEAKRQVVVQVCQIFLLVVGA